VNEPKSEKPHPRTSMAQASKPASSSKGYVHLHSKQELKQHKTIITAIMIIINQLGSADDIC